MPDWINSLSQGMMPHGYCLRWDYPLLILFISSNIGIAIAYFAIPAALRHFAGRRPDLPYPHMFKLFAAFILSCGITHVVKVWTIYSPVYWIEAIVDAWTAAISLTTAILLYPLIPKMLALRSPQVLHEANVKLEMANKELALVNEQMATSAENLKVARDQALEASSLKSAFIANVSHELRTPLSGVLGMNELLLGSNLDEEQRVMAEAVQDSARTLLTLVNDILDLSKIEAGKMTIETVIMHPRQIVEDIKSLLEPAARGKHIGLDLEMSPDVPEKVLGDPVRTHQVLLNLAGNAVKFTHRGRVLVKVGVEYRDDLRVTLKFEVADSGIGISAEEARMLFMPFTQADMSTTRKYGGTGLGLAISKRLVELMGGELGFQSDKGVGSTFWFSVPFKPLVMDDPTRADARSLMGNGLRTGVVLVVEDNQMMQAVVAKQLTSLDVNFRICGTAEEAMEHLDRADREGTQFALVLMDCHLPNMDGFEATKVIRKRERDKGRHIPIVAMTAGAMKGDPEKCIAAGMDDYLAKPYTLDQLREVLNRWSSIAPESGEDSSAEDENSGK